MHAEQRAKSSRRSTGRNIGCEVQGVLLFVVPEYMRPDNAFQLRIKIRKEARVAQQYPIEERIARAVIIMGIASDFLPDPDI